MTKIQDEYSKYDSDFPTDDHYLALIAGNAIKGNLAYVYLLALSGRSQINRTDGRIPLVSCLALASNMGLDGSELLKKLASKDVGMVAIKGPTVIILKFEKWGRTTAQIEALKIKNSANGARGGRPVENPNLTQSVIGPKPKPNPVGYGSITQTEPSRLGVNNPLLTIGEERIGEDRREEIPVVPLADGYAKLLAADVVDWFLTKKGINAFPGRRAADESRIAVAFAQMPFNNQGQLFHHLDDIWFHSSPGSRPESLNYFSAELERRVGVSLKTREPMVVGVLNG